MPDVWTTRRSRLKSFKINALPLLFECRTLIIRRLLGLVRNSGVTKITATENGSTRRERTLAVFAAGTTESEDW